MGKLTLKPKLEEYPEIKDELTQLASNYKNLVVTRKTLPDAKNARLSLRERRYDIQKVETGNRDVLNKLKRQNKELAESLISIIHPTEEVIDGKIKGIEVEIEAERERKRKEREEKLKKQTELFQAILAPIQHINSQENIEEIEKLLNEAEGRKITKKEYGDFYDAAITNNKEVIKTGYARIEYLKQKEEEKVTKAEEAYKEYFGRPSATKDVSVMYSLIENDKRAKEEKKKQEEVDACVSHRDNEDEQTNTTQFTPVDEPHGLLTRPDGEDAEKITETFKETGNVILKTNPEPETDGFKIRLYHSTIVDAIEEIPEVNSEYAKTLMDNIKSKLTEIEQQINNYLTGGNPQSKNN